MDVTLDNLIVYIEHVTSYKYEKFMQELEKSERYGRIPRVTTWIGKGMSDYHYNVKIGEGSGAVHIGWKHNADRNKDVHRMRMELNPSKTLRSPLETSGRENAMEVFRTVFETNTKLIRGIDIAFDIPEPIENIMAVSKTGRELQRLKGMTFFGQRGHDGQLKIYDKKKEREKQGEKVEFEHLTRVEYSFRMKENGIPLELFEQMEFGMNERYTVSKLGELDGITGALIFAVQQGYDIRKLSRRYRDNIKKELAAIDQLDLDKAYQLKRKNICERITNLIHASSIPQLTS